MDAGHGGQVLVSLSTEEVLGRHLPGSTSLDDLGVHRLKDLDKPEHVFQVNHPRLAQGFPPLRVVDERPSNLPSLVSSFVGREIELAELSELIESARLVTLTGVGGSGKTRLAIQLAHGQSNRLANGAWFVDLAPLSEPEMVVGAISQAVQLPGSTSPDRGPAGKGGRGRQSSHSADRGRTLASHAGTTQGLARSGRVREFAQAG